MKRAEAAALLRAHRQVRLYWLAVLSRINEGLPTVSARAREQAYAVENALGRLPPDQRRLLGYLYMDKHLYDRGLLCRQLCVSQSTFYRLRDQALDAFIKAYN